MSSLYTADTMYIVYISYLLYEYYATSVGPIHAFHN